MKIDPRFVFAHDKPSELEISFPGGSVRITAPDNSAEPYHAEIIVSPDEEFHLENIPYIRRGGDIIHIAPGPASVMYSRLDAPTVEEQREALSIDDTQALRRMFGNHMKEQIVNDQIFDGYEVGDRVRATSQLHLRDDSDGHWVTIEIGDLGTVELPDGDDVSVRWDKAVSNDCSYDEIEPVDEEDDDGQDLPRDMG